MVDAFTDFKGAAPGSSLFSKPETVWLDEGAVSRQEQEYLGFSVKYGVSRASPIKVGDLVEFYDDSGFTYDTLSGIPVMRKLQSTGSVYYGIVDYIEPNANTPSTDVAVSSFSDRLSQNLLRRARVVIPGLIGTREIIVAAAAGGTALPVADPAKIVFDLSERRFKTASSGGSGLLPLHHVSVDSGMVVTSRVLIGIGAIPMVVVS